MIKHIVAWKFKESAENADRETNIARAKKMIEGLKDVVPGMGVFEVGLPDPGDPDAFDMLLYSEFADRESLRAYVKHPEHVKAADFVRKVRLTRGVIDYESGGAKR